MAVTGSWESIEKFLHVHSKLLSVNIVCVVLEDPTNHSCVQLCAAP